MAHYVSGLCGLCSQRVIFDPQRVPVLHGTFPMCRDCTIKANEIRQQDGAEGRWDTDETIWQAVDGPPE